MARLVYPIRPVQHAISVENPSLFVTPGFSPWVSNGRIDQNSFKKRWGYYLDRSLNPVVGGITGKYVQVVALYQTIAGTRYTIYLTDKDFIHKTGTTVSYGNTLYATGGITDISASGATVNASGTLWLANVSVGDSFILDTNHTATAEVDENWANISAVPLNTGITLDPVYTGTTGAFDPAKTYKIRKAYSVPTNERWTWAVVDDKFCFTNGNTNVQYWAGSGYAADLNSTYATKARYCIEYAGRLFLADLYIDSIREPLSLRFSKEGDPTDWTDSTAGRLDLLDTEDYIFGLGKVGSYLVIYKQNNIMVYGRTGDATNPIRMAADRRGIGCVAPYSIIEFMGTNAFVGREDFYIMDGDMPSAIGGPIRDKFFSMVGYTEIERVFGGVCPNLNELYWVANTLNDGQITFIYNFKSKEWYTAQWDGDMTTFGRGAL